MHLLYIKLSFSVTYILCTTVCSLNWLQTLTTVFTKAGWLVLIWVQVYINEITLAKLKSSEGNPRDGITDLGLLLESRNLLYNVFSKESFDNVAWVWTWYPLVPDANVLDELQVSSHIENFVTAKLTFKNTRWAMKNVKWKWK